MDDISNQPLVQVACWCIGEYGDLLLSGACTEDEPLQLSADEVLTSLERALVSSITNVYSKAYVINALMKLSTRLAARADINDRIRTLVSFYSTSVQVNFTHSHLL